MSKVLVAYATNSQSAKEIAEELAKTISEQSNETTIVNLKKEQPDCSEYNAVIVGSGIRAGRWYSDATKYLAAQKDNLQNKKLGLFVTCGDASNDVAKAKNDYVDSLAAANGLSPDLAEAFPGILDLSKKSRHGWLGKFVLKMVAKSRNKGTKAEQEIDWDGFNDFRDWDKIREFGSKFANIL